MRNLLYFLGLPFVLVTSVWGQQPGDAPQRLTLAGLRVFAVHARVQASGRTARQRPDETLLHGMVEEALRREGIDVQEADDVRDGAGAQVSLQYLIIPIRDPAGQEAGFAASSCLHVSQNVRIPRFNMAGRITYSVAPTWSSCGIIVGDNDSYREKILQNVELQITRFLQAWRTVNPRRIPVPPGQGSSTASEALRPSPTAHRPL